MTVTRSWYLEVNAVPLATYAWEVPDLSALLDSPAVRGTDRLLPGVAGVVANRRRVTVTVLTFPLDVNGLFDADGTPAADPFTQLNTNMEYLRENLGLADPTGDGTVPAVFHRGGLDPWTADVHFLGFKGTSTQGEALLRTTFDLSIPAGQFESTGS